MLSKALFDLMMVPANLFLEICNKIGELAEEEYYGEDKIKQELLELQMRLEMEEITEEEYMAAEATLMKRLEEGRRCRGEGGEE